MSHFFDFIDKTTAHVSTGRAAVLGSAGSAAAITAAVSTDPGWIIGLRVATLTIGLLSGLGGLILVVMKAIQQRREMRDWARKNPW